MLQSRALPAALAAGAVLTILSGTARPAEAATISGYVMHCGLGPRTVNLADVVKITTDKGLTYQAQLNINGSYAVVVVDDRSGYNLFVYSANRPQPVWRQRVVAGDQLTICLPKDGS